jgi:hypothetical protein
LAGQREAAELAVEAEVLLGEVEVAVKAELAVEA